MDVFTEGGTCSAPCPSRTTWANCSKPSSTARPPAASNGATAPIRPENLHRYPRDWNEISTRIRYQRAADRCECTGHCGLTHPGGRLPGLHKQIHPTSAASSGLNPRPKERGSSAPGAGCGAQLTQRKGPWVAKAWAAKRLPIRRYAAAVG
ncbi:hypothetical protein GCM10010274_43850 [Streptomyces lavendofoliae]|uniref:Uncharacterized protein n=1 Tax=Streptomyces lavendofoliae TaxID=67314 RepID=A0A918HZJ2_9ACTN|nr:hypothetical protein GCM10010274_43850 [Streptomyces lavendofoliae]